MTNSLGIQKPEKETKVVVAMSGGVDSSVVAGLMKDQGYDVTGITLKLYDDSKTSKEGRQCCAGQDILDAKRVSEQLGIDHKILFYQKKFKEEVIDSFIDSYVAGETPIPCVQCNQTVKFRDLFKYAKDLKADALVTGHYVDRMQTNGKASMYRAKDTNRDQTYFLFSTTQEQLDYLRFPLGKIEKQETRNIASKLSLNVANKPDSQDICFVPNGDYSSVIKKFRPESFKPGDILDLSGKKLGEHEGIINYTIGQRKGIKISSTDPLYVVNIDADLNGSWDGKQLILDEKFNWTDGEIQTRQWTINKIDEHHYEGTASDVVGVAKGFSYGPAFKFEYVLLVPVKGKNIKITFDDWIFMQDEKVAINRATMTKFGFKVAELTVMFVKN